MFTSLPTWPHLKALPAQLLQIKLGKPLDSRQESSGRQSDLAAFAAGVSPSPSKSPRPGPSRLFGAWSRLGHKNRRWQES